MHVNVEHAYKGRHVESKPEYLITGLFCECSGVDISEEGSSEGAHSQQLGRVLHVECGFDVLLGADEHMGLSTPILNVMESEKLLILCDYHRRFAVPSIEHLTELTEFSSYHRSLLSLNIINRRDNCSYI
jgi:hypothetical protein